MGGSFIFKRDPSKIRQYDMVILVEDALFLNGQNIDYTEREIIAIILHEIGHYLYNDESKLIYKEKIDSMQKLKEYTNLRIC